MANYAIIDEKAGWLVNSVVWNGNLEDWQPPTGTIAVPFEEVDFQSLPEKPEECF